jgi:hypothetical protein
VIASLVPLEHYVHALPAGTGKPETVCRCRDSAAQAGQAFQAEPRAENLDHAGEPRGLWLGARVTLTRSPVWSGGLRRLHHRAVHFS